MIGERLDVVGVQRERLVDGREPVLHVFALLGLVQPRVAIGLVPVVGRDGVVRFGVVRLELGALLNGRDQLVELALPLVEAGELLIDRRFLRLALLSPCSAWPRPRRGSPASS